jgi:hypothetical protein
MVSKDGQYLPTVEVLHISRSRMGGRIVHLLSEVGVQQVGGVIALRGFANCRKKLQNFPTQSELCRRE